MITHLELQHWKSHFDSTLEFERGTNVIVGAMGSGKTSVMDAICYALFGTYPALQNRRVSLDETIMQKPNPKDQSRVALTFEYENHAYRVERTLFRNNKATQAKLYCDQTLIAGPKPSEVTSEIEKRLGVNYDLFSRAVYSEQNQIDYFLRLSPRERKEKFDELLQIHKYEAARTTAVQLSNRVKKNAADQKRFADEQEKNLSPQRLEELAAKIGQKQKEQEELKITQAELAHRHTNALQELTGYETAEQKHRTLQNQLLRTESEQKTNEAQLKRLQQRAGEKTAAPPIAQLRETLKQLEETRKTLEQRRGQLQKQLLLHTQTIGGQEARLAHEQKALQQILATDGHCPFCKKPLAEHDKQQFERDTLQLKAGIENAVQTERSAQEQTSKDLQESERALDENRREQKTASERIAQAEQDTHDRAEIQRMEATLEQTRQRLSELSLQLEKTPFDEKAFKALREQAAQLSADRQSHQRQAQNNAELIGEFQKQLAELAALQKSVEKIRHDALADEQAAEQLAIFTHCLAATQGQLREHLLEAINSALHDLWPRVYPYGDYTTCRILVQEGSYELFVQTRNGEWMRVEGQLSGGERSATAICIRLAFALVLTQNLGWIILDEPTHNLDASGVSELAELLKTHLPQLVEQIFVITHDKELERAATGTLYRIERDKQNDGASQPVA
ncbi:MAG: AAA family ATPase, partial [Candidatus Diapherotrites archaeon]|nr:AAA family ATPase [Candidatus Diapherotrites archaeon]